MKKIFIGIDFSKEKFDATLIKSEGLKECAPSVHEVFNNKTSGFRRLVTWVKAQSESAPIDSWLFCGENTGGYSIGLSNYLYASAFDMYKPQSASLTCLREVFLYRHSLVRQRVSLQVRRDEKRLTQEKTDIKVFMSFTSKHLITEVNKAIAKCDQKIKDIIAADDELKEIFDIITSMSGIGIQNATCLMVYTDNFQKFDMNARKIGCYYGIAPFGRQSGSSVKSRPQVSPFANRMIKSMLSQAALVAIKFDVNVYNYYQRLKERGKHPLLIHNNIKNKMLHALVAMVRDRVKYNPDHVYQTNKEIAYSAKC